MGAELPGLVAQQNHGPSGNFQRLEVAGVCHPVGPPEGNPATGEDALDLQGLGLSVAVDCRGQA